MNKPGKFSLSVLCVALISASQFSFATGKENEIVVTASKQSQYAASGNNVALSVLNSSQLQDANVTSSKQLAKLLPGLYIAEHSDTLITPSISLRGASQGQDFYNPPVTLYVDGVPQPSVAFIQPLGDIASVQLLKGPQGTLYGKYATGGIIHIITEKPDSHYRGDISAGYALRNGYRGKVNLSGPVVDGLLYGSISGLREVETGRMVNPDSGHKNLGGTQDNMGVVRLRLAPDNQPWEINTSYNTSCVNGTQGLMIHVLDHDPGKSTGLVAADNTGPAPDPGIRRCINNQSLTGEYNSDNWLFSAISSWNQIKINGFAAMPYGGMHGHSEKWRENIQELRAATRGAGHLIDGVIGLYHHDTHWDKSARPLNNDFTLQQPANSSVVHSQSFAVYTDLTWHVTTALDFGAGLRFSHDVAQTRFNNQGVPREASVSDNNLLGQLSAGYQLTTENRIYARIAQGYRPVGYDVDRSEAAYESDEPGKVKPYKAEKSISYEIGNNYQSDNFHLQGDIFYSRTSDLINIKNVAPWVFILSNLGDTRAWGAEIAGGYHIIPGWEIGANATLVRSRFTNDVENSTTYANRRVPSVPDFTAGIYINGSIATPVGTITPYLGVNVVGSYTFGDYDFSQKAWTTTDIRVAWQATDRINLSAYINNLFDKRYFLFADTRFAPADYGYANIGRSAGVDLKIDLF